MHERLTSDRGGYLLEVALLAPVVILLFLVVAQLGVREFQRMVVSKALTEATFVAAAERNPSLVQPNVRARLQTAWGSTSAPGLWNADSVFVTTTWRGAGDGNLRLKADLRYEVPSVMPIPSDVTWLGNQLHITAEQYVEF